MIHFDLFDYARALLGGVFIGVSASILLVFSGRIAGVSGILYRSFSERNERGWRTLFLMGLLLGGLLSARLFPEFIKLEKAQSWGALVLAGLLVGFGSVLGNGCTSGHGVCGISRLSPRSLAATATFMGVAAALVYFIRHLSSGGLSL